MIKALYHHAIGRDASAGLFLTCSSTRDTIECLYRYPDGATRLYELALNTSDSHAYLQLWKVLNGQRLTVPYGTMPFPFEVLMRQLQGIFSAHRFKKILAKPQCRWLSSCGFSLDKIVIVTGFMRYDYPSVYLFILANSRKSVLPVTGLIDRELLASCLGVPSLASSQLSAIRKLQLDGYANQDVSEAISVIVSHWYAIKPLVVHESTIKPVTILLLDTIIRNVPDVLRCHWFSYSAMDMWVTLPNSFGGGKQRSWMQSVAAVFLVQWHFLQMYNIHPASLDCANRMEQIMLRTWSSLLTANADESGIRSDIKSYILACVQPEMKDACRYHIDMIANDFLYNTNTGKDLPDETLFPQPVAKENAFFRHVSTVGDLRRIALELHNCAASRVWVGLHGNAEFWCYKDTASREVALLQLDSQAIPGRDCVIEFKGPGNARVSHRAEKRLGEWLAMVSIC